MTTSPSPEVRVASRRDRARRDRPARRWHRVGVLLLAALPMLATPGAASADQEEEAQEARLVGYKETVAITGGEAVTGTWMVFFALAVVGLSVMFKDAKRSHLD